MKDVGTKENGTRVISSFLLLISFRFPLMRFIVRKENETREFVASWWLFGLNARLKVLVVMAGREDGGVRGCGLKVEKRR